MTDKNRKENLFAKLAVQNAKESHDDARAASVAVAAEELPPSPAPIETAKPVRRIAAKPPEPAKGKRNNPDYCQANAYVPKAVRKAVDRALLDIDGLDYSSSGH